MTPLTVNPSAVVLVDAENHILGLATNVAPDLNILVTRDPAVYAAEAANKPFASRHARQWKDTVRHY